MLAWRCARQLLFLVDFLLDDLRQRLLELRVAAATLDGLDEGGPYRLVEALALGARQSLNIGGDLVRKTDREVLRHGGMSRAHQRPPTTAPPRQHRSLGPPILGPRGTQRRIRRSGRQTSGRSPL